MAARPPLRALAAGLATALVLGSGLPVVSPVLAQASCLPETEPNDTELDLPAAIFQDPICVEAALPPDDQDLLLWEVTEAQAARSWDLTLEGVDGTLTIMQLFPVESPPGQRPVVGRRTPILELSVPPVSTEAATRSDVLLPVGRYLVGVSRSGMPGGGEPTEVGYRLRIEPTPLGPAATELEPNDDDTTATPVTGTFEIAGDLAGSSYDVFSWTVGEAGLLWDVEVRAPLEASVTLKVSAEDGRQLASVPGDSVVRIYDLALAPGRYLIRLSPGSEAPRPYALRTTPTDAGGDAEPNDETAQALPVSDDQPVRGRLATRGDHDRYRLSVPIGDADLRDIRVIWRSEMERRLCLLDAADQPTVCRSGVGGAALPALALAPGQHILEVTGTADPLDVYALRVDVAGPAPVEFEAEPNDDVASASELDPAIGARGRGDPLDMDVYRLQIDGDPQLWRLDLTGQDIDALTWMRPNGTELDRATLDPSGTTATLTDLYLVPGEHWFSARVDGPEYTLSAAPLGPPDPDGEREPNGSPVLAESYRIGQRKVGRLPSQADVDVYRFTLAAPGHVRFRLAQPEDGSVDLRLRHGGQIVSQRVGHEAGATLIWDLALQPGDHLLELDAATASEGRYELTSERLDPFALVADQEPNDDAAW
ncbi:MAG TPA: hypothetical protein VJZ50_12060, partial [Candidatus Limnocylindrales bacterium]|nr:hypothetical protein [Candidatus Limnocylindrales bacterium]